MEFVIILFPLLTFIVLSLFKSFFGFEGAKNIVMTTQISTLVISLVLLIQQLLETKIIIYNFVSLISLDFFSR